MDKLICNLISMLIGGIITGIGILLWRRDGGDAIGLTVVLVVMIICRIAVWYELEY